jgi:hypothetical protein
VPRFGAGEAQDMGLGGFVRQVVDVLVVFPYGHALVVMPAPVLPTHAVRVADEKVPDVLLNTEVDDRPGGFVARIADASLRAAAHSVLRPLQLLKASRVLGAAGLLAGQLPQVPIPLPFEGADAAPVLVVMAARWISPRSTVACTVPGASFAWGTSTHTCNSNPRFHTSVQAPASSGNASGKTREARPRPMGKTTRLFSREPAWAVQ